MITQQLKTTFMYYFTVPGAEVWRGRLGPSSGCPCAGSECSPGGSAAEPSSWLILAVGRIQFLVFIGSKSCFLAGCQLSTSPSSLRFLYSFSRGPSIFKSANLLNPQISLYLSDPLCSPGEFFALG